MLSPLALPSPMRSIVFLLALWPLLGAARASAALAQAGDSLDAKPVRPNVLLVLVDDMGFGDYSMAGHPDLRTPHLDSLAQRSASFESFYVSPVCGMTRAALMTGCYPHRVGVHVNGRDLARGSKTLASELQAAGYATGIFGKWHLGDHFPSRPKDFGFEKSVVSRGGIIGQLAEQPNAVRYSDPFLMNDGKLESFQGYATDVHFRLASEWMESMQREARPFFALLSTNAPHRPYSDAPPEEFERLHRELLTKARAELKAQQALSAEQLEELESSARYFAMVERIDKNMGLLMTRLGDNGLLEQTLVLFLSDNGPLPGRYNAGLRGGKGEVYEGGIRTRFFAHWPGHLDPKLRSDRVAAHIDLMPTVLEACGVELRSKLDGVSLWPLLIGASSTLPERLLFFEAHQGWGSARQNYAVRSQDHKLVMPGGYGAVDGNAQLELYDLRVDPGESNNLVHTQPELAERLAAAYGPMADELRALQLSRRRTDQRIEVGAQSDQPQWITREHWKRTLSGNLVPTIQLVVTNPGSYQVRLRFEREHRPRSAVLTLGGLKFSKALPAGEMDVFFKGVQLKGGLNKLHADVVDEEGVAKPAWQVELLRVGDLKEQVLGDDEQAEPVPRPGRKRD